MLTRRNHWTMIITQYSVDYPNVNHPKRQISEPTFSSLEFLVHSFFFFFFLNTVYSERVTKPAEIARQTAKSLLKENGGLRLNNEKSAITSRNKVLCHFY